MFTEEERAKFRERFNKWQSGEKVYEAGLPRFEEGEENVKWTSFDYKIPYIPEKSVKLTNAGLATGARISTNMLDSLANAAVEIGLPVKTAIGLATKESTLGNPTDDRSMRTLLSAKNREALERDLEKRGIKGNAQYGQHLVPENASNFSWDQKTLINYYNGEHAKPNTFGLNNSGGLPSTLKKGLDFYKEHPDRYNPGQKNYLKLVNKRGDEVMNSPEVLRWYKEWEKSKIKVNRPEPYKTTINWDDIKLPKYKLGTTPEFVQAGTDNKWHRVTNDAMGAAFLNVVARPRSRGGNVTAGSWKSLLQPKQEKGLEIVSPEFEILSLGGGLKLMYDTYKHIPGLKIKTLNQSSSSWIHTPKKLPYVRKPYSVSWDDFIKKPKVGKYFDEGGEALVHESKDNPGYLIKLKSELGEGKTLEDLEFMVNRDLHINDLPGTEPIRYKGFSVSQNPQRILDRATGKPKTILNERFYPIYELRKLTPYHKVNTDAFKIDQEMLVNDWAALHGYEYLPNGWLKHGNISVSDQGFNNFAFDSFGNMKFIDPMIQTF